MRKRDDLHRLLVSLLNTDKIFYQPPESMKLTYPCWVYGLSTIDQKKADDGSYLNTKGYMLTYMTNKSDDDTWSPILTLENCVFDRTYKTNNMYHYVFTLFY